MENKIDFANRILLELEEYYALSDEDERSDQLLKIYHLTQGFLIEKE